MIYWFAQNWLLSFYSAHLGDYYLTGTKQKVYCILLLASLLLPNHMILTLTRWLKLQEINILRWSRNHLV